MTRPGAHVAASDCERCGPGIVAQPVNTVSSLAFVGAGVYVLRALRGPGDHQPAERAVGWAAMAAGLGSVAYHGPGTTAGRYLHDASLLALLGALTLADLGRAARRPIPRSAVVAVPVVALGAAHPRTSMVAQLAFAMAATAGEAARTASAPVGGGARWRRRAEGLVAGAGALAHVLGRTGGPWCRPDARLQPHAAWHVATATAIALRSADLA